MRSVLLKLSLIAMALSLVSVTRAQVNPNTQINWPDVCNAPGMVYNVQSNTCIAVTGFTWRGAWSSGSTYAQNDMVSLLGGSYISLTNGNTTTPPGSDWGTVATQGGVGPAGPTFDGGTIHNPLLGPSGAFSSFVTVKALGAPAAPTCAVGGSGIALTGQYQWEVAFRTAIGISEYSAPCALLTVTGQPVRLTLPIDTTGQAISWVIRRTAEWTDPAVRTPFFMNIPFWYDAEVTYSALANTFDDPNADSALGVDVPFNVEIPYWNTTSTTGQFFPPWINTPPITFSAIDNRPLKDTPDITEAYPRGALQLVGSYNVATCTENIPGGTCGWSPAATMGMDTTSTMTIKGYAPTDIVLNHYVALNAFTNGSGPLQSIAGSGGNVKVNAGQAYLFSYFVKGQTQQEQVNSHGTHSASRPSFDYAFIDGLVRRKWFYCVGVVTNSSIDCGSVPNVAFGSGTPNTNVEWSLAAFANFSDYLPPNLQTYTSDRYIGGFQAEPVATTAYGVCAVGDSLTEVDCQHYSNANTAGCSSWTVPAAGLLNVPFYNLGHGGIQLDEELTDYMGTTTIPPGFSGISGHSIALAGRCRYVTIEGGTNDIDGGHPVTDLQARLQAFFVQVKADGAIPVAVTVPPTNGRMQNTPGAEAVRQSWNAWLRSNCATGANAIVGGCPLLLDMDTVMRDPVNPSEMLNNPTWVSPLEGTHQQYNGRRAFAEYVAASYLGNTSGHPQIFDFPRPLPYQAVLSTTPTTVFTPTHMLVAGAAGTSQPVDGGVAPVAPGNATNSSLGLAQCDGSTILCSSGVITAVTGGAGTVTGTGTANNVSKWTGTASQGLSSITDNGTSVTTTEPIGGVAGLTADGPVGVSTVVGHYDALAQVSNIAASSSTNMLTVPATPVVRYFSVCAEVVMNTVGSGGDGGLPSVKVSYTDPTNSVTFNPTVTASQSGDLTTTRTAACIPIHVASGSQIQANTAAYSPGSGTALKYDVHVWLRAEH